MKGNLLHEMLADINVEAVGVSHRNPDYVLFTTNCFQALFSTINLCVKLCGLLVLIGSHLLLEKPSEMEEREQNLLPMDGPLLGLRPQVL